MLRLRLLGGLAVEAAGAVVGGSAAQPRRMALLAMIARAGARGVTREQLQALLWPDLDDERARRVLTHALYALRRDLPVEEAIVGVKELRLNLDTVWCDVVEFERAAAAGDLEHAAAVYGGSFLQGFRLSDSPEFERWADDERTALAHRFRDILEKLARDAVRREDAAAAVTWWRRAAAQDPLNARYTTELMHALVAAGNVAGALRQAQVYEALVDEELSLPPDREVVALAARIREDATRAASPAADTHTAPMPEAADDRAQPAPAAAAAAARGRDPAAASPPRRTRATAMGIALIALLSIGVIVTVVLQRGRARRSSDDDAVIAVGAIRDHRDTAENEGLGTVADLLATSLARLDGVRVVSTARMYELLAQSGASLTSLTGADIAAAARLAGADEFIDGALYELPDGSLRLDVRRTRLSTGDLVGSHTMVGQNLFALVDSGTAQLADAVGARHARGSIADVTTASEVAYRFYEEGLRHYFRADYKGAGVLFDAALREDSAFAMAAFYGGLSYEQADGSKAPRLFEQARRLAASVSERERLSIQAGLAIIEREPAVRAIADTLAVRFPLEVEGHLYSGMARLMAGQAAAAITPLQRVVSLDSLAFRSQRPRCLACVALENLTFAYSALDSTAAALREAARWARLQPASSRPWLNLAYHRMTAGQIAGAAEALRRVEQLDPDMANTPTQYANFWIRQDLPDSAEAQLRRMGEAGDPSRRFGRLWYLAIALREQGKLREAALTARRMRSIRLPPPDTTIREAMLVEAQVLLEAGQAGTAATLLDSLARFPIGGERSPSIHASRAAWALTHRASALFADGDTAALVKLADTLQNVGVKALNRQLVHHYVRGLVAFARGDLNVAAEELQAALPTGLTRARYHLAHVYLRSGRPALAVSELQRALRADIEGAAFYITRTELHAALAQAWDAAGRADSAAVHQQIVARSWRHADTPLRARGAGRS